MLIDEEGVYDPNPANDRLLLGVRGLVDENELAVLRRRMQVSREDKARRGALKVQPPTGLGYDPQGRLRLDPDEEVRGALTLLFEQFRRLGNGGAVVRYFAERQLRFPTRHVGGARDGELTWKPLTYERALYILHDPLYAGAYVYGRHGHSRHRKPREKIHQSEVRLPLAQWLVLRWDDFQGYISRAEDEANQQRLRNNRAPPGWAAGSCVGVVVARCAWGMKGPMDTISPTCVIRPGIRGITIRASACPARGWMRAW
ncbi:MAG: recombinase family protein [Chloroflexi bacterium]|nr:recombinase family protein [Chloroflexota bacterium]